MIELTSLSAALGSAKALWDLVRNANDAQLAIRFAGELANLQGQLLDVQQQALALQDENRKLRDEIRQIKDNDSFQFQHGVYWKIVERNPTAEEAERGDQIIGTFWDGPFCPLCKDDNGKAVRLQRKDMKKHSPKGEYEYEWYCQPHNAYYIAPSKNTQYGRG